MQSAAAILQSPGQMHLKNAFTNARRAPGLLARLFGCRHREMSRPFSVQGQAYRTCVDCGARRQFNLDRWEMQGDYYYGLPNRMFAR